MAPWAAPEYRPEPLYVDYPTLACVPKASYHWGRDVIAEQWNGGPPRPR